MSAPLHTNGTNGHTTSFDTDRDIDVLYSYFPGTQPAAQPLPEAPCSINVRLQISGRDCQLTLRGVDELEVLQRLERLLARYPQPQPQAPTPIEHRSKEGWCDTHNMQMTWNNGKNGKRGWYSHKTAQGWCNGRPRIE